MRKFKKVYVEITNVCNMSCRFCPKTGRPAGFMKVELFEKILSEVQGHARFIYLHVLGEPLLHPQIGTFLDLCEQYGLRVNITTNGTLTQKVKDVLLAKPALRQINFSLHSFEANAGIHSVDSYLDGVFSFIHEAKEKTNLQICLRLWNLKEGSDNENNRYILDRIEKEFSLPYNIEEALTPCNGLKVSDNIFLNQSMTFKWPDPDDTDQDSRGFCYGLRDQLAILVDGTVVPCCLDGEGRIALGNINFSSLEEIVEGKRAKDMYEGFSRRNVIEPLCRKCSYRLRFNN